MSGLSGGSKYDLVNDGYVSGEVTVGTSAVEAKVGGSALAGREILIIYNKSNNSVFYGPSGVTTSTGVELKKGQFVSMPAGNAVGIFLIAGSASNVIVVQEMS